MNAATIRARCEITPNGCWEWQGARQRGYGRIRSGANVLRVHRVTYEAMVGPIPDGLDLDHLCRNRSCCNPAHLEPVTRRENLFRSDLTVVSRQARRKSTKERAA